MEGEARKGLSPQYNPKFLCDPCYLSNCVAFGSVSGLLQWPQDSRGSLTASVLRGGLLFGIGLGNPRVRINSHLPILICIFR